MERVRVVQGGKVTIPIIYRKQFDIHDGEELLFDVQGDQIVISSFKTALATIRKLVSERCPEDVSLVDELIAERRLEAARENAQYE